MPHLLIDTPVDPDRLETLRQSSSLPVLVASGELGTQRSLPESEVRDAEAILCTFLPDNHHQMTSLRLAQLCSAGFKQVEGLGLSQRDLAVCTASGVNDVPIAEWAVMMMLSLNRDFGGLMRNQSAGRWDRDARFQTEVRGKTLGIWGYGGIGRETARLASSLGLKVHVLTRSGKIDRQPRFAVPGTGDPDGRYPEQVFAAADAKRFCASLDFLMLAIPETPSNLGLIDRELFDALPNDAFLLNPARGKLINEHDLLEALREGRIAGAALDTHFQYPLPPDHPLWSMPNVLLTPHVAGSSLSPHFASRLWELFTTNLQRIETALPPYGQLAASQLDPTLPTVS